MDKQDDLPPDFGHKSNSFGDALSPKTPINFAMIKSSNSQDDGRRKMTQSESTDKAQRGHVKFSIGRKKKPNDVGKQTLKSEPIEFNAFATKKTKTTDNTAPLPMPENGVCNDLLSMLSGPPEEPDLTGLTPEMLQGYTSAIDMVKNALKSFLSTTNLKDVALMIAQANSAFASLKALKADYGPFYNAVRSYILHCLEKDTAEKELAENMQSLKLLYCHEKLVDQLNEATRAASEIEVDLEKARKYMAPLKARAQDAKDWLQKLELELSERKTDLANLDAERNKHMEKIAALDVKLQGIASNAEEARSKVRGIFSRLEAAKVATEEARAQLLI